MLRRVGGDFLWWLDGLTALQAVGYFFLSGVPTGILFATVGQTAATTTPVFVAFGFYTLHCIRRPSGGWEVWGCTAGPAGLAGILRSIFGLHGAANAILGAVTLLLSLLLAWAYDQSDVDRDQHPQSEP